MKDFSITDLLLRRARMIDLNSEKGVKEIKHLAGLDLEATDPDFGTEAIPLELLNLRTLTAGTGTAGKHSIQ